MSPVGTKVVLKFHNSKDPKGNMKLISRTLGKLSLIDENYKSLVNDQEIWLCEIEKEIHPDKNKGVFLVKPINKIEPDKIKKLIPGFYKHIAYGKTIFLYPKSLQNEPWLISVNTREIFSSKYVSIIVPIEYEIEEQKAPL